MKLTPFIKKILIHSTPSILCRDYNWKESTIAFSARPIDKLVVSFQNLEKAERKSNSTLVLSESQAKSNGL